eukprot:2841884-Rhodomonas_salina.1
MSLLQCPVLTFALGVLTLRICPLLAYWHSVSGSYVAYWRSVTVYAPTMRCPVLTSRIPLSGCEGHRAYGVWAPVCSISAYAMAGTDMALLHTSLALKCRRGSRGGRCTMRQCSFETDAALFSGGVAESGGGFGGEGGKLASGSTPLSSYGFATRPPVLTKRMLLPEGACSSSSGQRRGAVSYTHLTLPTICSV